MTRRGYDQDFAEACFEQIKGFGSYGFPESHAASFALLVYVSAWIKKHHPGRLCRGAAQFPADGLLCPGRDRALRPRAWQVHGAGARCRLQRLGLHPGAQRTGELCLRLGFRQIDGFAGRRCAHASCDERGYGYRGFADFARRTGLSKRALVTLAEADAFRSFRPGPPRRPVGGAPPARR